MLLYVQVSQAFDIGDKFFSLNDDDKNLYARSKDYKTEGNSGYVAPNVEILNPKSAGEIREAFNYRPNDVFKVCG